MGQLPAVTCLCLTRNRRKWLPRAIRCFQAQTYPNRELLIVADGELVADLLPADSRIRLHETEEGLTIGQKRNVGCGEASGEIITHWDDDDFSAPDRLSRQVLTLESSGKMATGYHSLLFTDGRIWWRYDHPKPYAVGTSLCYRKSYWKQSPFPPKQIAEDHEFQRKAAHARQLVSTEGLGMIVAAVHAGNTCDRKMTGSCYSIIARPEGIGSPFD